MLADLFVCAGNIHEYRQWFRCECKSSDKIRFYKENMWES
jgi:hypothetical protein